MSPISPQPWRLQGQGLDLWLDVLPPIEWERPEVARLAEDPQGGDPVLLLRGPSAVPRRRGVLVVAAFGGSLQARAARERQRQALLEAWRRKGPYRLTTAEGEVLGCLFNPAAGGLRETWTRGHRYYQLPFVEVTPP